MKTKRPSNRYAKDLRTPKYKMRVVQDKRDKELIKRVRKLIRDHYDILKELGDKGEI